MLKSLRKSLALGHQNQTDERANKTKATKGTLRGAMAGVILPGGEILSSKCIRLDIARVLGAEKETSQDDRVVFASGYGHENFLESEFKAAGLPYRREPDTQLETTFEGMKWTGTPDFEIQLDGEWIGVEAKALVSPYSVYKQRTADWPFRKHLLQSAHYMTVFERDKWIISIGHYFYAEANKEKIKPQVRYYLLQAPLTEDGTFSVLNEQGVTLQLNFCRSDVKNYLRTISRSVNMKSLPQRPKWMEYGGIRSYDECNYCPMKSSCNAFDTAQLTFDEWLQKLAKGEPKK